MTNTSSMSIFIIILIQVILIIIRLYITGMLFTHEKWLK
jgi:hypothetical protein